jgi:DNA-binding Xre family transcriptional regulator
MQINTVKVNVLMAERSLNQKELSRIAGISRPTVSNAVRGTNVSAQSVKKIADVLGVPMMEIIKDE